MHIFTKIARTKSNDARMTAGRQGYQNSDLDLVAIRPISARFMKTLRNNILLRLGRPTMQIGNDPKVIPRGQASVDRKVRPH